MFPECPTPLMGRDILTKLGTTLVMGSFSEPYSSWLLLKNPLHLSSTEGQELWKDKINPQVWDQGTAAQAHQAEMVIIVL